jgi:hypothetical protein
LSPLFFLSKLLQVYIILCLQEIMPPKPPGGRPRKYQSQEEAKKADLEKRRLRRQRAQLFPGPADFIAYEPLHPDIPLDTPPSGLRISPDIPIPLDKDVQQSDAALPSYQAISPPPTQQRRPMPDEDAEVASQIRQIRINEQEANLEQGEYEAEILQQLAAARTLAELKTRAVGGAQKSFDLIKRRLGYRKADKWLDEFFHLVRLTHWVLPYPSNSALIALTKTSRAQGLKGRMMWFSAVYADPERVELPFRSHPITLYGILWNARQQTFGDGQGQRAWSTAQLITACRAQGIKIVGQEDTEEFWMAGKRSVGIKGFVPVWERTQPPRLEMMDRIRGKSLDELEDMMAGFSRGVSSG